MDIAAIKMGRVAPLNTPTCLHEKPVHDIAAALTGVLADVFALNVEAKNFHWPMSGPDFRDYHLTLDDQAAQLLAATDPSAERGRKIRGTTLCSIGQIAAHQRILDNDTEYVAPDDMLAELRDDNRQLTSEMHQARRLCDAGGDVASASLLEVRIDEAEQRSWFLFETGRQHGSDV